MATCGVCNGSGGHWAEDVQTKNRRWVPCPMCNGTGQR